MQSDALAELLQQSRSQPSAKVRELSARHQATTQRASAKRLELGRMQYDSRVSQEEYDKKRQEIKTVEMLHAKAHGITCSEAKLAGLTCADVRRERYTCKQAKEAGYTLQEMKSAGYSKGLVDAGYTVAELMDAGFTKQQVKDAGYT